MKKLLIVFLLINSINLGAQKQKRHSLGISFCIGSGDIYRFPIDGLSDYEGLRSYSFGINYYYKFTERISFESGLFLQNVKIKMTPNFYPGKDMTPKYSECTVFSVPMNIRISMFKYFFFSGGLLTNFDLSKDSNISDQTGTGLNFGFGGEIPVFKVFRICINPYLNLSSLIKFEHDTYPQRIFDSGIKLTIR